MFEIVSKITSALECVGVNLSFRAEKFQLFWNLKTFFTIFDTFKIKKSNITFKIWKMLKSRQKVKFGVLVHMVQNKEFKKSGNPFLQVL